MARKTTSKPITAKPKTAPKRDQTKGSQKNLPGTYAVEDIREKKFINGKPHYLVKWEGYPEDQCTWEPLSNLENVRSFVEEFEENLRQSQPEEIPKPRIQPSQKPKDRRPPSPEPTEPTEPTEEYRPTTRNTSQTIYQKKPVKRISHLQALEQMEKSARMESESQENEPTGEIPESQTRDKRREVQGGEPKKISSMEPQFKDRAQDPGAKKKVKLNPRMEIESNADDLPPQGHINYGDKVNRILNGKLESITDFPYYVCIVEWQKRSNGFQPRPTPMTSIDLKQQEPMMLLEFYESVLGLKPEKSAEHSGKQQAGQEEGGKGVTQFGDGKKSQPQLVTRSAKKSREVAEHQREEVYRGPLPEIEINSGMRDAFDSFNNDFNSE